MGPIKNLEMVLGLRHWAWALPLPSSWQLADLGDGITFELNNPSVHDCDWPPHSQLNSDSSDESCLVEGEKGILHLFGEELDLQSESRRHRRDSEGYILPLQNYNQEHTFYSDSNLPPV